MAQAIEELLTRRMSLKLAARSYNLPVSTLYERYRNARERREPVVKKKSPVEKLPINDKELDAHLIYHIEDHHARGLTLGRADICRFAVQIAECIGVVKCQPASSRTASKKFYSGFVSRHKELINRVMLKETNRSERDKRKLKAFLQKYKEVVTDYGIKPSRIHACVVTKVEVVEIDRAKNISALLSIDAAGETRVPPLFIYPKDQRPFRRIPRQDVPTGSLFRANSTGELTGESLLAWLRLFVEKTRPSSASPVILLIDSRTYPKELAVAQYVCRHYIHLLGIPTSKVNPLNQDPAKIYRNAYSDVCHAWLLGEEPEEDLEADFTFATRAFRRAGLWPEMKGMIVTTSKEKSREEESDESVTPFLLVELPEHPETLTFDNDIEMLCSDSGIIVND